jgi:predicted dehydrogenase
MACELVRNGRVGRLRRVQVGIGPGCRIDPQPVMPVPDGLDYEMWLGPAPWAPYTEKRCHWNFRWISDYSGGQVTDWGAHHIDIAHWGMGADETGPVSVAGSGEFPADGLYDTAVTYRFHCEYADGVTLDVASNNYHPQGVRFIGDDGWVHVTRGSIDASPRSVLKERIRPDEIHLPRPPGEERQGHRADFLQCVRTRREPITPIEVAQRSVTVAHLGNIAMLLGRRLRWDAGTERFCNDEEANRMLSRAMREPWRL